MTDGGMPPSIALSPAAANPKANDYGSIGLYNGRMNYTLPLLGVGGRGEAGYMISLPINQSWVYEHRQHTSIGGQVVDYSVPVDGTWHIENLRYMPGKLLGRSTLTPPEPICNHHQQQNTVYATTWLSFLSSDGSEINLVSRTNGHNPLPVSVQCNTLGDPTSIIPSSRGTEFVSDDGSGMRFTSDEPITDAQFAGGWFMPSGFLYFSNGTHFRIVNGRVEWMKDRNGNKLSLIYDGTNYNSRLVQITDSIGREIIISYNNQDSTYGLHDKITYPGLNGDSRIIRVSYLAQGDALRSGETLKTSDQLFGEECPPEMSNCPNPNPVNMQVVSSVWFPDNRRFRYFYNSYAELARVETPTGSAFEYDWGGMLEGGPTNGVIQYSPAPPEIFRQVLEKRIYPNGGTGNGYDFRATISKSPEWYVSSNPPVSSKTLRTFDNGNNPFAREVHHFHGNSVPPVGGSIRDLNIGASLEGKEYEADYYGSDGALLSRDLREWTPVSLAGPAADFRTFRTISIAFEGGKALGTLKQTDYDGDGLGNFEYFSHLNPKRSKAYHFKILDFTSAQTSSMETIATEFGANDLAAVSESDYLYDINYKARGILGLPIESRTLNPANFSDVLAKSQFVYDELAYFDNNYITTNWENPNSNLRGNVTTARTWNKDTSTWIESHTMFDNFGNVRKVWDTSGDPSRFVESEYNPVYKYAYSTKTKAPAPDPTGVHGTTEGSEISRVYDFNTGLLLSVTDANGQTATTEYDALLRPIRINPPAGGSISETIYNDTPSNIWVKSRQQIDANNWAESTTFYDNLGRVIKTRTKDLQGDVMSQIRFDSFGRVEKTSNPYRVDAGGNPVETVYWSKLRYDGANRVVATYAPAPEGQTGMSLGTAQFGISTLSNLVGTYATAIDASGRKSRAISGIYGLMRVDEATAKGGTADQDLGSLASPTQPTFYNYNIKGEMTRITQGSQNRYFMYDSLGRLIRVRQPEQTPNATLATSGNPDNNQWTAGYTYNVLGNVVSVTDAKNITITNSYDKAGRTTKRTYSDATPEVQYFYDGKGLPQVPQFSRGSLTKATSTVSEDRFTSFDNHGRLLASQQITDGQTYDFGYKYNLSGGLIEQTYPSGRIVRNFLDSDGGLSVVNTKAANGLLKTMASNFDYSATGSVRKMKLGNGLWETGEVNHLNQLTQVGLGTTATTKNLFKIDYEYGELNTDGTVDTIKNIGMIARTTTTIPTTSFVQTFKYDAINRLTEAKETTNSQQNWIQSFGYDRFGNRTQFSQTIGSTQLPTNNITHPTINQADNRFTTGQGYVYDLNGNLLQDAEGRSFTFNGDDKQTEVRDTATSAVIGQYFYDGSGARVKKVVPATGETTIFVYDAGGTLAAEYSTATPPTNPTTNYLTTDHLGSPRVITDAQGQVTARRDFMPFGEELGVGVGPRSTNLKYSATVTDNVRKRFTGYEKDDETGLDFAEARMYQNKHGRFTAPDPLLASASAANPQTFNRYTYTGNDPINYTDPSGLNWCRNSSGVTRFTGEGVACEKGWNDVDNLVLEVSRGNFNRESTNGRAGVGSIIRMNENGTVTVQQSSPEILALAQGRSVQESVQVTADSAALIASLGLGAIPSGSGTVSSNITPRGLVGLPPCPVCGKATGPSGPRLEVGASSDEVLDAVQTAADTAGLIPVIGEAADAISALISLARGDNVGAALGAASMVPFAGTAAGATKIGRRLSNAVDSVHGNSKASTKAQLGYEVFPRGERDNVVATGVSGGPVTNTGKSYRATRRVSKMNKSNSDVYDAEIVKTLPGGPGARDNILEWEKRNADRRRRTLNDEFHKRP
jgi:RHS repeat-associated protein